MVLIMLPTRRVAGYMEMRSASRRVGRKGERRALAVGSLTVSPGIPVVTGAEPFSETAV